MSRRSSPELPPGWTLATIPDLVGKRGLFVDGDWVETKDQDPAGDVRLIQLADVGDGFYRDRSARFLTQSRAIALGCTFLKAGDVLIARMPEPLGRACIFPGDDRPSVTVVDVCIVRSSNGEFDHRWLAWFVNAPQFRGQVYALQAGSTRKRISRKNLGTIPLRVPPLPEQHRLVDEIEKQFTRLDVGVAALRRAQENLKRYRAAVFTAACEGRLVPTEAELARRTGRPYETGADLLQRMLSVRQDKTRQKRVAQNTIQAAPASTLSDLPEGWEWTTLESIAEIKGGITKDQKRRPPGRARLVPYLRVANVQRGYLDLAEVKQILATEEEIQELALLPGDILFNEGGDRDKLGRGWVWNAELPECIHQNHVFRARLFSPDFHPKFLSWYANSPGQSFFFEQGKHTTNLASISMAKLRRLPVPVPPAAEQRRIVAEIDRLLSFASRVENVSSASLQRANRLRQAILRSAFGGMPEDSGHGAMNGTTRDQVASPLSSTAKAVTTDLQMPMLPSPVESLMQLIEVLRTLGGPAPPDTLLTAANLTNDIEAFFDLLREGARAGTLSVPVGRTGAITEASDAD